MSLHLLFVDSVCSPESLQTPYYTFAWCDYTSVICNYKSLIRTEIKLKVLWFSF